MNFTIGTDPEFFIKDLKGNLKKSSIFTKGNKDELQDLGEGFSCHADNVMLELNIPPSLSKLAFINNINKGKKLLSEKVLDKNHYLDIAPSREFDEAVLTDEQDREVGCDPDYDVYTLSINNSVDLLDGWRYAGGHIHIGFVNVPDREIMVKMIKAMDFTLMPIMIKNDNHEKRKQIYGTPGRFRPKSYGFEYRSLSNFWLQDDGLISQVYDAVKFALDNYESLNEVHHKHLIFSKFQINHFDNELVESLKSIQEELELI